MDLEQGLETKIRHPNMDNGMMRVDLSSRAPANGDLHFRYFQLTLWSGQFEFQTCPPGELDMSVIQGASFILKIYRKETELMIDLDGENQIQLDTVITFSYPDCYDFWGVEKINQFKYDPVSENVATHYRIPGSEESDDSRDDSDKLKPGK